MKKQNGFRSLSTLLFSGAALALTLNFVPSAAFAAAGVCADDGEQAFAVHPKKKKKGHKGDDHDHDHDDHGHDDHGNDDQGHDDQPH